MLTYLVIVLVNLVKNVILLYFYFVRNRSDGGSLDSYTWFLVAMMLQDAAALTVTHATHTQARAQPSDGQPHATVVFLLRALTVCVCFVFALL